MTVSETIKFTDVIKRAQIDRSSAQHALKHPEHLLGMPEAGTQGVHRMFSLEQAMALAICVHMLKIGVPLARAGQIVEFCRKRIKRFAAPADRKSRPYRSEILDPWKLTVLDQRYVRLWREQLARESDRNDKDEFVNIVTGEVDVVLDGSIETTLNLTKLESHLAGST